MLTHMVSTELRRLFNIQTQQEKGTSKKKYIFKIIQTPYRVSFIWTGFFTFYHYKVAVLLCRYLQDACSCNDLRWSNAFQCNERMKLCCWSQTEALDSPVTDHLCMSHIQPILKAQARPRLRRIPVSLSLTHRKSERHGAISPGKRLQNHTDLLTVAVSSIFISWFPSAEQTGDLLSCMHTSLGLCTQICCLHIGKCSLPHSVDFTVGFGTLQIKSKITFCHVKNRLSVSSAISKADSEWFTNSHITFTWKHHRVCVADYYLQPSKLGDPGHNLVVRVNNLGPDPGKTCM